MKECRIEEMRLMIQQTCCTTGENVSRINEALKRSFAKLESTTLYFLWVTNYKFQSVTQAIR